MKTCGIDKPLYSDEYWEHKGRTKHGLGFETWDDRSKLVTMEGQGGGSCIPSYSNVVSNKSRGTGPNKQKNMKEKETRTSNTQEPEGSKPHEEEGTHEGIREGKKVGDNGQRLESRSTMRPCKPKFNIKAWGILNDPSLREHKDHMATYVVICKFMGIWPTEKALYTWVTNT